MRVALISAPPPAQETGSCERGWPDRDMECKQAKSLSKPLGTDPASVTSVLMHEGASLLSSASGPRVLQCFLCQTCEEFDVQSPMALLQYAAKDVHSLPARSLSPPAAACREACTSSVGKA